MLDDIELPAIQESLDLTENRKEEICQSTIGINALYKFINADTSLRHLLSYKKLSKCQRSNLARQVIPHLVNKTPGDILTPAQIKQWAEYAIEIFPEDDITFYFYTVPPIGNSSNQSYDSRQLPSKTRRYYGCFWDRWNNYRKVLRENGSVACKKRQSTALQNLTASKDSNEINSGFNPDTENQNILKFLEDFHGTEITDYLKESWVKSKKDRFEILSQASQTADYVTKFRVLKNQNIAVELIDIDYNLCTPKTDSKVCLLNEMLKYKDKILKLARQNATKFRDKSQKTSVEQIFALLNSDNGDGQELTAALLLLPYLFSSGGKINFKGGRASRAEASRAFVLLAASLTDAEVTLNERRNTLKKQKRKLQPLVVAVGRSYTEVTSVYVYIDEPLYHLNNIIDAVHLCFKIFFVFDLRYPLECEHVWLLLQKLIYAINLPTDKTIISVKQIIANLSPK